MTQRSADVVGLPLLVHLIPKRQSILYLAFPGTHV